MRLKSKSAIIKVFSVAVMILYTLLVSEFWLRAREVALPTRGGISVSEVLEGWFPGGATSLLLMGLALGLLLSALWLLREIRQGQHRGRALLASAASVTGSHLSAVVAGGALHLLLRGQMATVVAAVAPGEPLPPPEVVYAPYPAAILPLAAAGLHIAGLWLPKLALAWGGLLLLALFSGLFLFSSGAFFLPFAAVLLLLLSLVQLAVSKDARSSREMLP